MGGWTYFAYDALNRLTSEIAPDAAQTSHTYDAVGRRTEVRAVGNSTYYAYDEVRRVPGT